LSPTEIPFPKSPQDALDASRRKSRKSNLNARNQIVPIIVIALALPASAQQSDRSLRLQIESVVSSYAQNFNKQNASGIASLYTKDGVLVNPAGPEKSVEQYYQNAIKTGFNHQDIALEDVLSLGPDAAISMGEVRISGRSQNGSVLESNVRWTAVEVREGGTWKIRLLTAFPTGQAPAAVPSSGAPK
jgi:uncharacterized protein (TIGR02246 family)